jgi:ribosomal protein S18 acetylase RimI-like enzyme
MPPVRRATVADLPLLAAALAPLPLLARYGNSADGLEHKLESALGRGEHLWVYDDGAPRGLAWCVSGAGFGLGGYLRLIAVAPTAQDKGVGKALLEAFESTIFAESAHAFLLVSDFNTTAQTFYERHGYLRVGALPKLVLPDVDELIYWKRRPPS